MPSRFKTARTMADLMLNVGYDDETTEHLAANLGPPTRKFFSDNELRNASVVRYRNRKEAPVAMGL